MDPMTKSKWMHCDICHDPSARIYKVAGLALRHVCDECFVSRCVNCGAVCVDHTGKLLPGVGFGIYHALFCERCLSGDMDQSLDALAERIAKAIEKQGFCEVLQKDLAFIWKHDFHKSDAEKRECVKAFSAEHGFAVAVDYLLERAVFRPSAKPDNYNDPI